MYINTNLTWKICDFGSSFSFRHILISLSLIVWNGESCCHFLSDILFRT